MTFGVEHHTGDLSYCLEVLKNLVPKPRLCPEAWTNAGLLMGEPPALDDQVCQGTLDPWCTDSVRQHILWLAV
jgi:hypothetical protein